MEVEAPERELWIVMEDHRQPSRGRVGSDLPRELDEDPVISDAPGWPASGKGSSYGCAKYSDPYAVVNKSCVWISTVPSFEPSGHPTPGAELSVAAAYCAAVHAPSPTPAEGSIVIPVEDRHSDGARPAFPQRLRGHRRHTHRGALGAFHFTPWYVHRTAC
jgi:hypothetical protein